LEAVDTGGRAVFWTGDAGGAWPCGADADTVDLAAINSAWERTGGRSGRSAA
jgi:hypothetical protein